MLVLIPMQCKVLIGLVTSESVPMMKFCEKGDEAWDSIETGSFFMQLIEAAREAVPRNCCSNYTLSYNTEKQYLIS